MKSEKTLEDFKTVVEEIRAEQIEEARYALRKLREAQDAIIAAAFDLDDNRVLNKALTLIGDTMDGISEEYDLPFISER